MGFTTHFWGQVTLTPPLNESEIAFLQEWASRAHNGRDTPGVWNLSEEEERAQEAELNKKPSLWARTLAPHKPRTPRPMGALKLRGSRCQWIPTSDGSALVWDGEEKFYEADAWMRHLIDHFLRPGVPASPTADRPAGLSFNHTANGVIFAEAEPEGFGYFDAWRMDVVANHVTKHSYEVPLLQWDEAQEELLDEFDLVSAIEEYRKGPAVGIKSVERLLRLLADEFKQPAVMHALGRFLWDSAVVLPESHRLRDSLTSVGLRF